MLSFYSAKRIEVKIIFQIYEVFKRFRKIRPQRHFLRMFWSLKTSFYIQCISNTSFSKHYKCFKTYRNESKTKGSNKGKKLVSQHWIIYKESKIFSPSYCFGQTEAHRLGLQRHEFLARQWIPSHLLLNVARMVLLGQINCGTVLWNSPSQNEPSKCENIPLVPTSLAWVLQNPPIVSVSSRRRYDRHHNMVVNGDLYPFLDLVRYHSLQQHIGKAY